MRPLRPSSTPKHHPSSQNPPSAETQHHQRAPDAIHCYIGYLIDQSLLLMNLDYYRKAKGREPIVINLDSEDQHPQPTPAVLVKAEETDLVPADQPQSSTKPFCEITAAQESIDMLVEYD